MAEGQMIELLGGLTCSENDKRKQATQMYKDAKEKSPDELIMTLMKVVAWDQAKQADKKSALVYLRQLLNKERPEEFSFPKMQEQNKQEVAQGLLTLFEREADEKVQTSIGNAITALAEFVCSEEDPRGWLVQGQTTGWPALMPCILKVSNCQVNQNFVSAAQGLKCLKDLIGSCKGEIVRQQQNISVVLQAATACADIMVKVNASLLIVDMVEYLDKKDWAPLASTLPFIMQVCTQLAQANKTSELEEILQAFISVASIEADFFKNAMATSFEPVTFLAGCVKSKEADDGIRNLALEWIISYAEKKPKWLTKSVPKFGQTALECCMAMMLEIEDGESELKAWAERMDDEEGEEDADELYSTGEEAIDRLVEAIGMDALSQALFQLIGTFTAQAAWQAKHAALACVKQTVEYVEEKEHMAEMAKLLIAHVNHAHPRVRYTALHAIGQLANDQAPQFQEAFHGQVMPLLLTCMDDKVDRVAAMAMSAFVSFAEELKDMMHQYSQTFMEKFLARLTSSQHRGIQEESITAIAVIAAVLAEDFVQYYDKTMPLLKQLIMSCTGEKQQRLRGKAFECLSLLGVAVGKDRFLPDAQEAIKAMLTKTDTDADDMQREYIKEAIERICHCLKKDFLAFLPLVLPGIFQSLNLESDASIVPRGSGNAANEEDEPIEITVGGKLVKVKTSKFEEMHSSVSMLNTFISTMEEAYFDFVGPTGQALLPLINLIHTSEEAAMLGEDARGEAFTTWAHLIKAAKMGSEQRQQPPPFAMVNELLTTLLDSCIKSLGAEVAKGEDCSADELRWAASGIAESLKNAGPGYLDAAKANTMAAQMFQMIEESMGRTAKWAGQIASRNAGFENDEDDEDQDPLEDENRVRIGFEEALGAIMKANPDAFAANLQGVGQKMQVWMTAKDSNGKVSNMMLALHLACDLMDHLKEKSCPIWPVFMPSLFASLLDKDADNRIAAAYAINLAATVPAFGEAAPEAFKKLAQILTSKPPKKREDKANLAMDNAVAAMFSLGRNMSAQCPPEINPFALFLAKLPLKNDLEEAKKVHKLLCETLMAQNVGLIGANQENLGKILSVLAEIHKQEDVSNDEIDVLITNIFKAMPKEMIAKAGQSNCFTEKQQKRIEKLLR